MWVLWVMFGLAAALPIVGFGRLLWRAQAALDRANRLADERGFAGPNYGEAVAANPAQPSQIREQRNAVVWDISLVGSGLILGAVASIVSLYL
jgi:hypothetical protein